MGQKLSKGHPAEPWNLAEPLSQYCSSFCGLSTAPQVISHGNFPNTSPSLFPHRSWALGRITSLLSALPVRMEPKWEQTIHLCSPSSSHVRDCSWQLRTRVIRAATECMEGSKSSGLSFLPPPQQDSCAVIHFIQQSEAAPHWTDLSSALQLQGAWLCSGGVTSWGDSPWTPLFWIPQLCERLQGIV